MTAAVSIRFARNLELNLKPRQTLGPEAACRWLDEQFERFGAEPLRASGKVLIADKILAVASAAGYELFARDAAWAERYAASVTAALGRPVVCVAADDRMLTY
ncbi:MAG: hypothetical protein AB7L76_00600 [Burkholderiaceae bacterium]